MVEPLRIYLSDKGWWRGEVRRDGAVKYFSLRTKDEGEARAKWHRYCESIKQYNDKKREESRG